MPPTLSSGDRRPWFWNRFPWSAASTFPAEGGDLQRDQLLSNSRRFADGLPANNVLLWGARGMGKSSLIKAVHAAVNAATPGALALIEIHREDLAHLPQLLGLLRGRKRRCICSATTCPSIPPIPATSL